MPSTSPRKPTRPERCSASAVTSTTSRDDIDPSPPSTPTEWRPEACSGASSLDDDPGVDELATAVATSAAEAAIEILGIPEHEILDDEREDLIREIEYAGVHKLCRLAYAWRDIAERRATEIELLRRELERRR